MEVVVDVFVSNILKLLCCQVQVAREPWVAAVKIQLGAQQLAVLLDQLPVSFPQMALHKVRISRSCFKIREKDLT